MTKGKAQWRKTEAQKLTLNLIDLGYISKSEKLAGRLLLEACITAYERTRKTEKQKPAYIGVEFGFPIPLDMAIYIITELPKDWEHCNELKSLWQQAKGKKAKNDIKPTIDRIYEGTAENRGHYERGNIQVLSYKANLDKSAQKKMKPRVSFVLDKDENGSVTIEKKRFRSITATEQGLNVSYAKAKKYSFHDSRAEIEAINARFLSELKKK